MSMSVEPLTPSHVQRVLDGYNLDLKVQHYDTSTATSELAAAAIGCVLGQIAKSLCFMVNGMPVLVVAAGDQRVDTRKLSAHFGVGRKKIKTASAEQCVAVFGYAPGGVCPVGHRTPDIPILLDDTLQRFEIVFAAAGAPDANFGLSPDQLQQITAGTWMDVRQEQ